MNWFDAISLRAKLMINFLLSGGVLIAAIVFCIIEMRSISNYTKEIAGNWVPSALAVAEINQFRYRYRLRSVEYITGTDAERGAIEKSMYELDGTLTGLIKKYESLIADDTERRAFEAVAKSVAGYRSVVNDGVALVKAGKYDEAHHLQTTVWVTESNAVRDAIDALQKYNGDSATRLSDKAAAAAETGTESGIVALIVGILLAFVCSFFVSSRLTSRLNAALISANEIAKGNLTVTMPKASADEVGQLTSAMSNMQQALRNALRETTGSANTILSTSQVLNGAVQKMEKSAGIQSAAASAIAANVEQLSVSINIVADNTSEASRVARESDAEATDGHRAIEQLVAQISSVAGVVRTASEQISQLKDESEKISNIVAVIKDIAEQTNLLALNAAIEAARAGEAGRGFAVVADEVRKLSERTAASTGEISRMVGAIQLSTGEVVSGIAHGVQMADDSVAYAEQAGGAIARMHEMAQKVSALIGDIDGALREQSSASAEVAKKIEDIATQSEESSVIANETAQAANSMSETANAMQKLVTHFRV